MLERSDFGVLQDPVWEVGVEQVHNCNFGHVFRRGAALLHAAREGVWLGGDKVAEKEQGEDSGRAPDSDSQPFPQRKRRELQVGII